MSGVEQDWPPQHGDVAYYEDCVPGGDPYRVTVVWRHRDPEQGWFNVAGTWSGPVDVVGKTLRLLVRNGRPVHITTRAHTAADKFAAEYGHAHPWVAKIRALGDA